jgi:hypothetical protein
MREEKERKTNSFKRKQQELERVRMLHDLFFKKPISKPHTENNTASKQFLTHQHP